MGPLTATLMAAEVLLLVAAWRWRGGNDRLVGWMALLFAVSEWAGLAFTGTDRQAALGVLDAALVSIAAREWISGYDLRGWWIGLLGFAKIALRVGFVGLELDHMTFAAVVNATFIVQVFIAGGMADGLGRRLSDYLRGLGPRGARLLRNVEGR